MNNKTELSFVRIDDNRPKVKLDLADQQMKKLCGIRMSGLASHGGESFGNVTALDNHDNYYVISDMDDDVEELFNNSHDHLHDNSTEKVSLRTQVMNFFSKPVIIGVVGVLLFTIMAYCLKYNNELLLKFFYNT